MPRPPKPAKLKASVVAAVSNGMAIQAAARKFKISAPTVKRWVDAAKAEPAPPAALPAHMAPAAADAPAVQLPPDGASTLEVARWTRDNALRDAIASRQAGNHAAAATLMRVAENQGGLIARLEKQAAADGDAVRYSRAEIDKAMQGIVEKFAALLARPLTCQHCHRELAAQFAGYDRDALAKLLEMGR